jgi:hypothetical protein
VVATDPPEDADEAALSAAPTILGGAFGDHVDEPRRVPMPDLRSSNVRTRVLLAVRDGAIIQRRSRLQWWTTDVHFRRLSAAERKHLFALLNDGTVRFVSDPTRHGHGRYELAWPGDTHPAHGDTHR